MAEVMQQTVVQPAQPEVKVPEPSLMERVASFKPEPKVEAPPVLESETFNVKELESIKDPVAKAAAERAYKSFQSDYTKKTQAIAEKNRQLDEERKALETKATQANQKQPWTADKIQRELLSDPTFVAEAQRLAQVNPAPSNPKTSGLSDDQWSALTSEEKAKFNLMEQKLAKLEQQSKQSEQQAQQAIVQQQHQSLRSKFANYDSDIVDTTVKNIVEGKAQIGLEHIWKAMDYESAVNRAYELGRLDAGVKAKEKIGNMSFDGGQVSGSRSTLEPEKNESTPNFFKRLANARLLEVKK
jgi:hypothetical protein